MDALKQAIDDRIATYQKQYIELVQVLAVDVDARTCTIDYNGIQLKDIELQVVQGVGTGILIVPSVGSYVSLAMPEGDLNLAYILSCSKVDSMLIEVEKSCLKLNKDGLELNGGSNGGLVKINDLVRKLNTVESEISSLKTRLATFETLFNAHTHVAISLAAPTAVPVPVVVIGDAAPIINTQVADLEDTTVTH